jgi:hypothetical protein
MKTSHILYQTDDHNHNKYGWVHVCLKHTEFFFFWHAHIRFRIVTCNIVKYFPLWRKFYINYEFSCYDCFDRGFYNLISSVYNFCTKFVNILLFNFMFSVALSVNGPSHEKHVGEKSEVYRIALIFIITIFRHQVLIDLFRLRLIVSSKGFHVVFIYSVYNSALILASCCLFLLHVIGNLIFILLFSR